MGALRTKWTKAKDLAKHSHTTQPVPKEVTLQAHNSGLPPFPITFDKDFGPILDAFEKAKAAKKADEIKKQMEKAKGIIPVYKKRVDDSKEKLNDTAKKILKDALADIDKDLKA